MEKLNIEDLIDTYVTLQEIKDDSIIGVAMAQAIAHSYLATILTVCIEYGKSLAETQEILDSTTKANQAKIANYTAKVESNG
jgi:hypothetical protein